MASLWDEYLTEVLRASKKSARFRVLRGQVEEAAGYKEIFREWNALNPEQRAQAWRRLVETTRAQVEAARELCLRCGECCEKSSPTLLLADLPLLHREVLTWNEVYALPQGDLATSREGKPTHLKEERLKVREVPGSRQCWFYQAAQQKCRIYEQRPEQCRRQQCWSEPPPENPRIGMLYMRGERPRLNTGFRTWWRTESTNPEAKRNACYPLPKSRWVEPLFSFLRLNIMTNSSNMRLIIAVVHDTDSDSIMQALLKGGHRVSRISSTGSFLRHGNATLLIGVEAEKVKVAIQVIQ